MTTEQKQPKSGRVLSAPGEDERRGERYARLEAADQARKKALPEQTTKKEG